MEGCTIPGAVNYNPAATENDGSCVFLVKHDGICYAFQDTDQGKNESFTLSYSFDGKDWVFYHDYVADFYFRSKKSLFSLKDKKIYRHHEGAPGVYYQVAPKSFFVDMVVQNPAEFVLNSIHWVTEVLDSSKEIEFSTLTHITVWNNQQCTGRIALNDIFDELEYDRRKIRGTWGFNEFRDMVKEYGSEFLEDLFNNYAVKSSNINTEKSWYDRDLMHDTYFIIRLEFDNISGKQVILHGADVNATLSPR